MFERTKFLTAILAACLTPAFYIHTVWPSPPELAVIHGIAAGVVASGALVVHLMVWNWVEDTFTDR